jgi:outer membrane protein insertion porin family
VKERSTGSINLGAGYGSQSKFFLTTQISEINLMGRGQILSFQATYAADRIAKSFNLGFTEPYTLDTKWSTGADVFFMTFKVPGKYLMRKLGFDLRVGYPLTDDVSAYITYKNEGLAVVDRFDPEIDSSLDEGVLSSVIWSVARDKRNNRMEPTNGSYQNAAFETAGLGGNKKFLKFTASNSFYRPIVGDLVFRNKIEYGHITMMGSKRIPPAEKFYLGGPNNLKGFDDFSIGPSRVLSSGLQEPLGGTVEMFTLVELEYPLIREAGLKFVTFFDAGNAFAKFPGTQGEDLIIRTDWGFGIRWFSPIGPLRFEWGFPFAPRPNEDSPKFSFFIGPPF